jgi:hypothetical protein
LQIDHSITRRFELDYLVLDALFLVIYVLVLVRQQRFAALRAGVICGLFFYLIDGVIWYRTGVREYALPAPWAKHLVDFMMDISYGIVGFGWVWIAFERRNSRDVASWTAILFAGWIAIPVLSRLIPLMDEQIMTVRHMQSQVWIQIVVVLAGYAVLIALGYSWRTIGYVLWVGCMLSFMMESALLVSGVRPPSIKVLIYETVILTNQGIPYLCVIRDKILPALRG